MQRLLARTRLFANAHLQQLSGSDQRTVFYSNVSNILYAHSIMAFAAAEKDSGLLGNLTGDTVSPLLAIKDMVQAAFFGRVGYYIGELGLVR